MGFDQASIEKGAKDAELLDSGKAEAALLEDLNKVSPSEQLNFLKSVSEQTKKDQGANSALPTLELTDDGASVKQVQPSGEQSLVNNIEQFLGNLVFHNPDTAMQKAQTKAQ